jgi:hypothetical protein
MKSWFRLGTIVIGTLTAAALTFSAASAAPPGSPDHPSPAGQTSTAKLVPMTPRPPLVSEALYVPILPCRIADTRHAFAGILTDGASRPFYVRGTTHFLEQGGRAGGCGIPNGATGVTTNVTSTAQSAIGYVTGYPNGTAEPLTNFISYRVNTTVTANPTFALSKWVNPLTLTAHGGRTQAIVDVTGYYIPQLEGLVDIAGRTYAGTDRMVTSTQLGTGYFRIEWDTDVSNCAPTVSVYGAVPGYATAQNLSGLYTYVHTFNPAGALTNFAFHVAVGC